MVTGGSRRNLLGGWLWTGLPGKMWMESPGASWPRSRCFRVVCISRLCPYTVEKGYEGGVKLSVCRTVVPRVSRMAGHRAISGYSYRPFSSPIRNGPELVVPVDIGPLARRTPSIKIRANLLPSIDTSMWCNPTEIVYVVDNVVEPVINNRRVLLF